MFAAPRFIAIDDRKEHLEAIINTLQQMGTSCFGIHYDVADTFDPMIFLGVRCLFMDLHLTNGIPASDDNKHFAIIADILSSNISQSGGPFVLIVWTEYGHKCDELRLYLDTHLDAKQLQARPLAVLALPKERFINTGNGTITDAAKLKAEIKKLIESIPQLAALLEWETDVLAATGETLASLLSLIPDDKRISKSYSEELDLILSRVACATVGRFNVAANPRAAISDALVPILADRLVNQTAQQSSEIWKTAITKHGKSFAGPSSDDEAGRLNRMLHLAMADTERCVPTDWGVVIEWPDQWTEKEVISKLGLTGDQMLGGELKIEKTDRNRCRPRLVRIGAVCDYAQNRIGPITFLLGMEIPRSAARKTDSGGKLLPLPDGVWQSPTFVTVGVPDPFQLYVHSRFPVTMLPDAVATWKPVYRLREQLLMQLISKVSAYLSRPGIVEF